MFLSYFKGWRSSLALCTGATALVASFNIILLVVGSTTLKSSGIQFDEVGGLDGVLFVGSCAKAKELSIWAHLAINILSTVLLTSGNYAQQMLTAPNRQEVDSCHIEGKAMEIGLFSYSNLGRISKKRSFAWAVLVIASIPIHLLYNSVVSLQTTVNAFPVYMIPESNTTDPKARVEGLALKSLERLENDACIAAYSERLISDRADLVLVTSSDGPQIDYHFIQQGYVSINPNKPPNSWLFMCKDETLCDDFPDPDNWYITSDLYGPHSANAESGPQQVKYCLSKPTQEECRLTLSILMLVAVIGCNALKLFGFAVTWLWLDAPLLTLGDAIASFLHRPLLTKTDFDLVEGSHKQLPYMISLPEPWLIRVYRPLALISRARYGFALIGSFAMLSVTSYLLKNGLKTLHNPSLAQIWNKGFGKLDVNALVKYDRELETPAIVAVLCSNLPQLLVTILYTTFNGIWTAARVGKEWNSYGLRRKSLRTTSPMGQQRRTHWLSLPWRYALPMTMASTTLHWLISQSLFFVRLLQRHSDGHNTILTASGYSCIAIIFSIVCGSAIILTTVVMTLIPFKAATPQPATNSMVIRAACQRPKENVDAALGRVKWGSICPQKGRHSEQHCCVTTWEVEDPQSGESYTGIDLGSLVCSCCSPDCSCCGRILGDRPL